MDPDKVFSILMTASLKFRETLQHILATNPDIPSNVRTEMETELAQITEAVDTVFKTGEAAMAAAKAAAAAAEPLTPEELAVAANEEEFRATLNGMAEAVLPPEAGAPPETLQYGDTVFHRGDMVLFGSGTSPYEVAGFNGGMVGIYDEPPGKHIDWVRPDSLTLLSSAHPPLEEHVSRIVSQEDEAIRNPA